MENPYEKDALGRATCGWPAKDPLMVAYHDQEWGVPLHDDHKLFEFVLLDAAQAGLNWSMVLKKRENFRAAFDNFDAESIARYDAARVEALLQDPGIIRNRLKVNAFIKNAQGFLKIQEEYGSFARYIWQFVNGKTIDNHLHTLAEMPTRSPESDAMSSDLKSRGFSFVGSTICYAFMQAAGLVNDHLVHCFRYEELKNLQKREE
jgi:DNA-3-methyladenine glycosylase I